MPIAGGLGGPALPVDETGEPLGTAENPLVVSGAPAGDATIVDGGDVTQGAIADAVVAAGAAGTVSAKLRKVTAQLNAIGLVADAAETSPAASATVIQLLKGILTAQNAILAILTDVYDAGGSAIRTTN